MLYVKFNPTEAVPYTVDRRSPSTEESLDGGDTWAKEALLEGAEGFWYVHAEAQLKSVKAVGEEAVVAPDVVQTRVSS